MDTTQAVALQASRNAVWTAARKAVECGLYNSEVDAFEAALETHEALVQRLALEAR